MSGSQLFHSWPILPKQSPTLLRSRNHRSQCQSSRYHVKLLACRRTLFVTQSVWPKAKILHIPLDLVPRVSRLASMAARASAPIVLAAGIVSLAIIMPNLVTTFIHQTPLILPLFPASQSVPTLAVMDESEAILAPASHHLSHSAVFQSAVPHPQHQQALALARVAIVAGRLSTQMRMEA